MRGKIGDVILDQQESRLPAIKIEPGQHFDLMALDVDRNEIDRRRRADFLEDIIERADRNFNLGLSGDTGDGELPIERRMRAEHMERHCLAGIGRRRAGHRGDVGAPQAPQPLGKVGLRLHQHAIPAGLFKLPALRAALRIVGADLDEESFAQGSEELGLESVFDLPGEYGSHRFSL